MKLLLAVKPIYAEGILSGTKKAEFRKVMPKKEVTSIHIYMSQTKKRVVGEVFIESIVEGRPEELWEQYKGIGGIDKKDFFEYFKGREKAFAFLLENSERFNLEEQYKPKYVPQSFCYIE